MSSFYDFYPTDQQLDLRRALIIDYVNLTSLLFSRTATRPKEYVIETDEDFAVRGRYICASHSFSIGLSWCGEFDANFWQTYGYPKPSSRKPPPKAGTLKDFCLAGILFDSGISNDHLFNRRDLSQLLKDGIQTIEIHAREHLTGEIFKAVGG